MTAAEQSPPPTPQVPDDVPPEAAALVTLIADAIDVERGIYVPDWREEAARAVLAAIRDVGWTVVPQVEGTVEWAHRCPRTGEVFPLGLDAEGTRRRVRSIVCESHHDVVCRTVSEWRPA